MTSADDPLTGLLDTSTEPSKPAERPRHRPPAEYPHTVAFRLSRDQMIVADAFRSTFPGASFTEAFRWLFASTEGRELIARRIRGEIR